MAKDQGAQIDKPPGQKIVLEITWPAQSSATPAQCQADFMAGVAGDPDFPGGFSVNAFSK